MFDLAQSLVLVLLGGMVFFSQCRRASGIHVPT